MANLKVCTLDNRLTPEMMKAVFASVEEVMTTQGAIAVWMDVHHLHREATPEVVIMAKVPKLKGVVTE